MEITPDPQISTRETPSESRQAQPSAEVNAILHAEWSGPLPPPSQLLQYEKAHPGLAERIVAVFETQFRHRHTIELKALQNEHEEVRLGYEERRRGQHLAFALCLVAILSGAFVGSHGQQVVGSVIAGTGLAGLAAAFIYGRAAGSKKDQS